jgi:transmembrane sensor
MNESPDWKTLDRYLAGEASPDEEARIRAWANGHPQREALLTGLKSSTSTSEPAWNADAAWKTFETRKNGARVVPFRRRISPGVWLAAAGVVVAVGLGIGWRASATRVDPSAPPHEVFTLDGQRTTVTLDDGTRVSLNGASRLRYAASYGRRNRDVELEGEAYFEVKHDERRPFRVHTRNGIAEDLGTRFTVRAYADQSSIEIAVSEGVVGLRRDTVAGSPAVRLEAGDLGVLPANGSPSVFHPASLDRYTGWTTGTLVLDGVPLRQAAKQIERWFGVQIVIEDSALAARPVFARFQKETVQQVIDALGLALGARSDRRESTYTLTPGAK